MSRKVISGHGEFNENYLDVERRKKKASFEVPAGVTITFYAPYGAKLENCLANEIEKGTPISSADVEMRANDAPTVTAVPTPYPYVYGGNSTLGKNVIDYTVKEPGHLKVEAGAHTVTKPTPLRTIVEDLVGQGFTDLHFACCGGGFSDSKEFKDLFPHSGYYVGLKA
jgi:hypothetical protein